MIPYYLFDDYEFWVFSVIYTLGVALATAILTWPLMQVSSRPKLNHLIPKSIVVLFAGLIIFQFFHQAEHVTQMYQFGFLGMSTQESHGIVWFLDDEWNHFIFNFAYTIAVTTVFIYLFRLLKKTRTPWTFANVGYMIGFFILEGWHLVEHTYRISQHIKGLCDQCPGIIDVAFSINRLVLHFWFNFIALILPLAVFVWFGVHKEIARYWKRSK